MRFRLALAALLALTLTGSGKLVAGVDALPLTITAQTAKTITVAWAAPANIDGYEFKVDGRRVSNTWDASRSTVTFGKPDSGRHGYEVDAIAETASGSVTAPPVASDELPIFQATITPNWLSTTDLAASNYQQVWIYPTSPTTPYVGPDSTHSVARYLLLDPRYSDSAGHKGQDEWWFVIQLYWPSSYQPDNHGSWGREVNFHNVAGDAGPNGGVGWAFGAGNSSLGLDWLPGDPGPDVNVEPAQSGGLNLQLPTPARDAWHTYTIHFIAGRTDGTTVRPGAITVWADGVKGYDLQGINTVQRAQGPDGQSYVQRWMQLWEGDYTRGLPVVASHRLVLTRIGTSLLAALADRPTVVSTTAPGQFWDGAGLNLGAPSVTQVGTLPAAATITP